MLVQVGPAEVFKLDQKKFSDYSQTCFHQIFSRRGENKIGRHTWLKICVQQTRRSCVKHYKVKDVKLWQDQIPKRWWSWEGMTCIARCCAPGPRTAGTTGWSSGGLPLNWPEPLKTFVKTCYNRGISAKEVSQRINQITQEGLLHSWDWDSESWTSRRATNAPLHSVCLLSALAIPTPASQRSCLRK